MILTSSPEVYSSDEELRDLWEDQARTTLEENIYKTPIICDLSVVANHWTSKVVTPTPAPRPRSRKNVRKALDTSVFQNSQEKRQEISIEGIRDQIETLHQLFLEFQGEQDPSKKMQILTDHSELASGLQEQCYHAVNTQKLKISQYEKEIKLLTDKLTVQKQKHQQFAATIEESEKFDEFT